MENKRLSELYNKWYLKTASQEEVTELIDLLENGASKSELLPQIVKIWQELEDDDAFPMSKRYALADRILGQSSIPKDAEVPEILPQTINKNRIVWYWAAACILLVATAALFFNNFQNNSSPTPANRAIAQLEADSVKQSAILILNDGTQVIMDSLQDGQIMQQQGAAILLTEEGELLYKEQNTSSAQTAVTQYNTLRTPKGRLFHVQLADGTKVWLNAESQLKYPISFEQAERRVAITGEAYFEVAKNSKSPFVVQVNNIMDVEVLGTSFNVNAYTNEGVIGTALVSGSVRVIAVNNGKDQNYTNALRPSSKTSLNSSNYKLLQPGEEALFITNKTVQSTIKIQPANLEKVMAWKNGLFNFDNSNVEEVMRQLARWYNIEVVYEGKIPEHYFMGKISRNVPLKDLLEGLQSAKINFELLPGNKLLIKE